MNSDVNNYIDRASENHKAVLSALRKLIFTVAPEAIEQFKWSRPVYALARDFCYLQTTKKHVNLGFFEFAKIETNPHLIEGTGKSMRHIKINDLENIADFQIKEMIEEVLS